MLILSTASHIAFSLAIVEAQALHNKFINPEHLFLGLCKVEDILIVGREAIPSMKEVEWEEASKEIQIFRDFLIDKGIDSKKSRRLLRKIIYDSDLEKGEFSGHRTQPCREIFTKAEEFSKIADAETITLKQLFYAVLNKPTNLLINLFLKLSVNIEDILKYSIPVTDKEITQKSTEKPDEKKTPFLNKFSRDLTQLARDGELDPIIGRKKETRKVAQILVQRKKNNPILVGDAGVGKTCIVEGLAQKILEPDSPVEIRNLRILELNMASLVAGTKYRGEFEERLEKLIEEASSDSNIVLFFDEIHTLVGAGAAEGTMDAANILKPALARGSIKCIGATTTSEYRKYIEKDPALERRFQTVWVDEPTKEETLFILKGLKSKFKEHYGLEIPDKVIENAVDLSVRYMTDLRLPDKAIDIIDQACSRKLLKTLSPADLNNKQISQEINIEDIATVISERCRIPVNSLNIEESERLLKMETYLSKRVIGQNHAVKEVSETIRLAKAGLKDPKKPIGVFLFLGPSGTGKTELAKTLADFLFEKDNNLITFDMSEYQEKHSVSKLIGAPPGYVGYDEEGLLARRVRTNPNSVIVFDEIEKAHPDIFDLFLQIFDEGRLTDAHGRRINFSESIIILTSNIGSKVSKEKKSIGIALEKDTQDSLMTVGPEEIDEVMTAKDPRKKWRDLEIQINKEVNRTFRPELLNRISKKIIFYPLERNTIKTIIVEKLLRDLNLRLSAKDLQVVLSDASLEYLIDKAYNEIYGARESQRIFDRFITEPLSQKILKDELKPGKIQVSVASDHIYFENLE